MKQLEGYTLTTRADLFANGPKVRCWEGATSLTAEELAIAHFKEGVSILERVKEHAGAYVIYDPWAGAEGWVLVGDDPEDLVRQTVQMHSELMA